MGNFRMEGLFSLLGKMNRAKRDITPKLCGMDMDMWE